MCLISTKGLKIDFQNREWNYRKMKYNCASQLQKKVCLYSNKELTELFKLIIVFSVCDIIKHNSKPA